MWVIRQEEYLAHHGVKGQKWGVRRYQNSDGTLTSDGKKRYRDNSNSNKELNEKLNLSDKQNKAIKIGAAIAGNILLAYGIYKATPVLEANISKIMAAQQDVSKALDDNNWGAQIVRRSDGKIMEKFDVEEYLKNKH